MARRLLPFPRRFVASLLTLGVLALAGCGGEEAALPDGTPVEVVGRAPDVTLATGRAEVVVSAPTLTASGEIDFATGESDFVFEPDRPSAEARLELRDPRAVVDLVRGATEVVSYGGSEVRGASTLRYEVQLDPARAAARTPAERRDVIEDIAARRGQGTIFADVFVDRFNRLRRVTIPVDYRDTRPMGRERRIVPQITVDFTAFARG